jgi:hypothetical protein
MSKIDEMVDEYFGTSDNVYEVGVKKDFKKQLLSAVLECVGEDETLRFSNSSVSNLINQDILEKNQLRSEIRANLKQLFGEGK